LAWRDQRQGQSRASVDGDAGVGHVADRYVGITRTIARQRITPVIPGEEAGEQFGTEPAAVAPRPVDVEAL
jgi:hypothetical protein